MLFYTTNGIGICHYAKGMPTFEHLQMLICVSLFEDRWYNNSNIRMQCNAKLAYKKRARNKRKRWNNIMLWCNRIASVHNPDILCLTISSHETFKLVSYFKNKGESFLFVVSRALLNKGDAWLSYGKSGGLPWAPIMVQPPKLHILTWVFLN